MELKAMKETFVCMIIHVKEGHSSKLVLFHDTDIVWYIYIIYPAIMIDHELYQGIFWYIYIPIIYQFYQYHVWMVCYNYMKWIMFGFMCWTPGINAIPSRWDPQILGTYGLSWMILIRFRVEKQVIFRHFSIVCDGKKNEQIVGLAVFHGFPKSLVRFFGVQGTLYRLLLHFLHVSWRISWCLLFSRTSLGDSTTDGKEGEINLWWCITISVAPAHGDSIATLGGKVGNFTSV